MLQFVCDVVKDTGNKRMPVFLHWIRLDWIRIISSNTPSLTSTTATKPSWNICVKVPIAVLNKVTTYLGTPNQDTIKKIQIAFKTCLEKDRKGPQSSGFQTGVRRPKGVRDGFPGGPREDSEK